MTRIQYGNLTIRKTKIADAKQLVAWWNDGAVMAHAGFPNGLGKTEEEECGKMKTATIFIPYAGWKLHRLCR